MSGSLGFQCSKRRPFHFQKSFHCIDVERLRCGIFQAFLVLYLAAYKLISNNDLLGVDTFCSAPQYRCMILNAYTSSSICLIKIFLNFFLPVCWYYQFSWITKYCILFKQKRTLRMQNYRFRWDNFDVKLSWDDHHVIRCWDSHSIHSIDYTLLNI